MIVYDLETKGLAGDLVVGGVWNGKSYFEFRNYGDFLNLLKFYFEEGNVYAHNGGKYDNRYILQYCRKNKIKITNLLVIQNGFIFNVHVGDKKFRFRDSMHILPKSLKSLCESFEVEHPKIDFGMKKWISEGCPETDELREYLKADCISLFEVLEAFKNSFGITPRLTIAGTAFIQLLRSEYRKVKLRKLCYNYLSVDQEKFIRESYKGGRVEVFERYGEDLNKYDINSLYPAVMYDYDYPFGQFREVEGEECEKCLKHGFLGVYRCKIKAPYMYYPYLALRKDNKLIFPCGSWQDTITSFEILEGRKRGYQIEIEKGISYSNKGKLFQQFIGKYYFIKSTSEGAKKEVAKLFLNSTYGKFGQKRERRQFLTLDELLETDFDPDDPDIESFDGGFLFSKNHETYQNRAVNPIYSAFITAYARHNLYLGIEEIQKAGGRVFYCDTDSIASNVELPAGMIDKTDLGKWKFEGFFEKNIFVSPKLYSMLNETELNAIPDDIDLDEKRKLEAEFFQRKGKGIPKEQLNKISFDKFLELIYDDAVMMFSGERVTGIMEHFVRLDSDKSKYIGLIGTKKRITGDYTKRELLDLIRTRPLSIDLIRMDEK